MTVNYYYYGADRPAQVRAAPGQRPGGKQRRRFRIHTRLTAILAAAFTPARIDMSYLQRFQNAMTRIRMVIESLMSDGRIEAAELATAAAEARAAKAESEMAQMVDEAEADAAALEALIAPAEDAPAADAQDTPAADTAPAEDGEDEDANGG